MATKADRLCRAPSQLTPPCYPSHSAATRYQDGGHAHAARKHFREVRSLACKKNKARFRTGLIGYTTIGLMVLLNRTSSSERPESGDKRRSDLPITLSNTKTLRMIMCKMAFAYWNSQKSLFSVAQTDQGRYPRRLLSLIL